VAIPVLNFSPSSQNQRVSGYEVGSEEQPKIYVIENVFSGGDMDELIWAAYRQIFSEHQTIASNRQTFLESQLRYGQISVKDFIRGLATSDSFRRLNLEPNSNYRFVDICVQRILGRDVYSDRERIAWSILLPTKGLQGFIDALVDSDEYASNFGDNTVPFQLRRILPQRAQGETPFNLKSPRYDAYHRTQLGFPQTVWQNAVRRFKPQEQKVGAGNPQGFLGMARAVTPSLPVMPRTPLANINIATAVPYRKR